MSMDGKLAVELIAKAISDEAIKLYERHEGKFTAQNTLLAVACVELACRRKIEFDNFVLEKLIQADSITEVPEKLEWEGVSFGVYIETTGEFIKKWTQRTQEALEEKRKKSKEA